MFGIIRELAKQSANPSEFFNNAQTENWKHPFFMDDPEYRLP
jgi:hypothetical protein